MDSFYTPKPLAEILATFQKRSDYKICADFSAGDGELLRALECKYPSATCIATDISEYAINEIKTNHKNWKTSICNFLNDEEINKNFLLRKYKGKIDLIHLNPPFSCRETKKIEINLNGKKFKASKALIFVAKAISFLSKEGELYAILPRGVLHSDRDSNLLKELRLSYNFKILDYKDKHKFKGCSPHIALVSLCTKDTQVEEVKSPKIEHNIFIKSIIRGSIHVNKDIKDTDSTHLLLHSTHLKKNKIIDIDIFTDKSGRRITAPAVVFPRVGNPSKEKICCLPSKSSFIISDCIFAISTNTQKEALKLKTTIINNWEIFKLIYNGTGAKYTTLEKLKNIILQEKIK